MAKQQQTPGQAIIGLIVFAVLAWALYSWVWGPQTIHSTTTITGVGTTNMDCTGTLSNSSCTFTTTP